MGVWIETVMYDETPDGDLVTPYVGVWIETASGHTLTYDCGSHPTWVCGLKLKLS